MRIKQEQLLPALAKSPPSLFVVSGNEPLLVQEACDEIRKYCRRKDFSERLVYHAAKQFDWSVLDEHTQSFSLFGDKKLIEIQLDSLPAEAGKKRLINWAEAPPDDCCLLIRGHKIESSTLNTKWFKAIESHCLHVQIWPVGPGQLSQWVSKRMQQAGFRPTTSAVRALCDHVEGNLLAAKQEIEKLKLLKSDGQIDENDILTGIANSNKFNVFNLVDACLQNNQKQTIKIMQTLEAESFEPSIVLWSLTRELRLLAKLYGARLNGGQNIEACLRKERVFKNKWGIYQKYLQKNKPANLPKSHYYCQLADKSIKGLEAQSCWRLLTQAALILAGLPQLSSIHQPN